MSNDKETKVDKHPAPPTKMEETDRMRLSEKFFRIAAAKNAIVALRSDLNSFEVKKQALVTETELTNMRIQQLVEDANRQQEEFNALVEEYKTEQHIPDHMTLNLDTGAVTQPPPQNAQPGQPVMPRVVPNEQLPPQK